MTSDTLRVPGACLCYEVRGEGPLLLLMAGGDGGGRAYSTLADRLADDYTVVTYDRRGAGHSPVDDAAEKVTIGVHADDAHSLLATLTAEPAYVFGSSSGALVGLDLAMRYPQQVRMLVAHEPPVRDIMPEFDQFGDEILVIGHNQGGWAVLMRLMQVDGVMADELEADVVLPPPDPQDMARRGEAFLPFGFLPAYSYRLDQAALAAAPIQLVLAAGRDGADLLPYRNTIVLAQQLGLPVVEFPGHHAAYVARPTAFVDRLRAVLAGTT